MSYNSMLWFLWPKKNGRRNDNNSAGGKEEREETTVECPTKNTVKKKQHEACSLLKMITMNCVNNEQYVEKCI